MSGVNREAGSQRQLQKIKLVDKALTLKYNLLATNTEVAGNKTCNLI